MKLYEWPCLDGTKGSARIERIACGAIKVGMLETNCSVIVVESITLGIARLYVATVERLAHMDKRLKGIAIAKVIGMDWLVDQDAVIVCGKKGAAPIERARHTIGTYVMKEVADHYKNKDEHKEHLKAILELLKKEKLYAKFSKRFIDRNCVVQCTDIGHCEGSEDFVGVLRMHHLRLWSGFDAKRIGCGGTYLYRDECVVYTDLKSLLYISIERAKYEDSAVWIEILSDVRLRNPLSYGKDKVVARCFE
ncbi:hypothetical protein Tco_0752645 [Tanacetum coccineum]|uniref:Uncharacterized protein n=1 Tax=Tanacetum coccineum TaxID=301880 RepID=A0ABQ4Z7F8_9ASTR